MTVTPDHEAVLLYSSDLHGTLSDTSAHAKEGLARIRSAAESIARSHPHTILIDNGDLLQGTPLSHEAYRHEPLMDDLTAIFRDVPVHACVMGNHDLDYGRQAFASVLSKTGFTDITGNVIDRATGEPAFGDGYRITQLGSVKIALIGLTSTILRQTATADSLDGLMVTEPICALSTLIPAVKALDPDVIIVSYHGGTRIHPDSGERLAGEPGENEGLEILELFPEVDALLCGHQHASMTHRLPSGQVLLQPGHRGSHLGQLVIRKDGNAPSSCRITGSLLAMADYPPHPKTVRDALALDQTVHQHLQTTVVSLNTPLTVSEPLTDVWLNKHPLIEGIHQALRTVTGAPITMTPLLCQEPFSFSDRLTMEDIHTLYPYPNRLVILSLSGSDIKAALEHGVTLFQRTSEKPHVRINPHTVAPHHYEMWDGVSFSIDLTRPPNSRIRNLTFNGRPITDGEVYDVATTAYRAGGAGGYSMFTDRPVKTVFPESVPDVLIRVWSDWTSFPEKANHNWRTYW